jgi:hypothetical protein
VTMAEQLRQEGWKKGRQEGELKLLERLLIRKFGEIPPAARARIEAADGAKLEHYAEQTLTANSIEAVFAD